MRYQGRITSWKDEKGFGFVTPNGGGDQMFLHISDFSERPKRLEMASSQETAPSKLGDFDWRLRSVHGWFLIKEAVEKSQAASGELLMPIFEYKCKECDHEFEALVYGKEKADCPKCRSSKLEPKLSVFAVSSKGTSPSPGAPSACGSCGDPRGPGACSMN